MNTSINSTDKKLEFTGRLLFERVLTNESASGFIEYEAFVVNNKKADFEKSAFFDYFRLGRKSVAPYLCSNFFISAVRA